ncbi:3-oxoacyl-[acyl-carrier-protein] synthase II, chloroplastic isoform X2 [Elaeis guineensis]|uniref:beta-ketoacyl-[acyl-carrier-protein] synthase I n=1 Tax=Elaeis guineensis var. tenera TaxID=51953 RepID=A0A6I9S595_ELAGV|nr:3-oxoacyl-[acyl-carrier-protein] synthase II, chloroplastic isoform X2 [Elaeis guineensis]
MAGATVASPLCTWLVAACMSVACDEERPLGRRSSFPGWRRRVPLSGGEGRGLPRRLISALRGSGIQGLMSSFLALEPCAEFYSSRNGLAFVGKNGFSPFGQWNAESTRRQRRAAHSSPSSGKKVMSIAMQPETEGAQKKRMQTKQRRVAVTGMGVVTPLSHDPDIFYEKLLEGVSGISEIETFDCSSYPTRIAGEIKSFSSDGWVAPKFSKRIDKFMLYMLTAGKKALENGGVTEDVMSQLDKARCGVLIGSAMGGMTIFNDAVEALRISYKKMNPFCVPFAATNMGSAMLAMDLGWMGPNYSISTACATSNFCILNAAHHILRGETDVMLCGGSDAAIIPIGLGGFVACRALSQRNADPTKASRPWDVGRDGFVMGEGAGVLLLEELEHAKQRGAEIYAEFLGGSFTCDAYHMTEPHPEGTGIILCIEKALAESGVAREDVNYVNAHATSTPSGDLKEYQALIHCFGQNPELKLNSTKSMIGHLLGAAGAVEAIAAVQAIRTGWVHPNINLDNPEENVDVNKLVGSKKERLDVKVALSNSFGFGGHNSSILFAPYQ